MEVSKPASSGQQAGQASLGSIETPMLGSASMPCFHLPLTHPPDQDSRASATGQLPPIHPTLLSPSLPSSLYLHPPPPPLLYPPPSPRPPPPPPPPPPPLPPRP